jgi:general nucleoside transport system permease protein
MTATTLVQDSNIPLWRRIFTRRRVFSIVFILFALGLFSNASLHTPETTTTLTFAAQSADGSQAAEPTPEDSIPPLVVSTQVYLNVVAVSFIAIAVFGLLVGVVLPEQLAGVANILLAIAGAMLIPTILIIAAASGDTNVITLIQSSFKLATPLAIGAMAGIWCERSGVVNIAIEGMMLVGACFGFWVLYYLRLAVPADQYANAQLIGVIIAVLGGGTMALLHGWLSIKFGIDQIISGTVINILAVGSTAFIRREYLASTESGLSLLPTFDIPILSQIPILGSIFRDGQPIFYLMFVLVIASHIVLFYTSWGLRTRAIGEKPSAADTLGIDVNHMRWTNVFIAGLMAGLAGAWFSMEITGSFTEGMTRGSGFIALAAMIFGNWTPAGAFAGALLFGFSDSLGQRLQILEVPVPYQGYQFLQMVPYIMTLIVIAGLVGRSYAPKAAGIPYKKE